MLSGQHHDFPLYRNVVHEVTQVFAAASREVLAVEAELAGPRAQPVLARHVRNLQELEQTRLATVRPPLTFGAGNGPPQPLPLHMLHTSEHLVTLPLSPVCLQFPPRFCLIIPVPFGWRDDCSS